MCRFSDPHVSLSLTRPLFFLERRGSPGLHRLALDLSYCMPARFARRPCFYHVRVIWEESLARRFRCGLWSGDFTTTTEYLDQIVISWAIPPSFKVVLFLLRLVLPVTDSTYHRK